MADPHPSDGPDAPEAMTAAEGAELMESASVQNAVAVAGPGALLMVPVAKVLAANGMAHETQPKVWTLDLGKLVQTMLERKRWNQLKDAAAYDVNKSILVSTTDVRRSNSAAMYLALTSYAKNGDVVTDRAAADPLARQLAELFKHQGYQENYVNGNFDDYVAIGMGKAPMAFIYEYQLVSHALA